MSNTKSKMDILPCFNCEDEFMENEGVWSRGIFYCDSCYHDIQMGNNYPEPVNYDPTYPEDITLDIGPRLFTLLILAILALFIPMLMGYIL